MTIDRATLPAEFYDRTTAKLLKQPEPQYFFAMLANAADARTQFDAAGISMGLPGREIASAGLPYVTELDRLMLAAVDSASEAMVVVEELGKGPGHTIRMNRPAFSHGGFTEKDRQVLPTQTISVTPIDVASEQQTITLARYVGPFASNGSVPQPYAIDALDALLPVHRLSDIVGLHLKRDRTAWLDAVVRSKFEAAATNILYVGDYTADNDYVTTDTGQLGVEAIFRVEEKLASTHIPTFSNGRWKMTISPRAARQLKLDSVYAAYSQFHADGKNPLFPGYISTVGRMDLYEVSNLSTVNNSSSVPVYRNIAFGPGAVGMGVGKRPTVQDSTDDNYGETAKVIWCSYEGFDVLDERFLVSLRTS